MKFGTILVKGIPKRLEYGANYQHGAHVSHCLRACKMEGSLFKILWFQIQILHQETHYYYCNEY